MENPLRIALIGLGRWGKIYLRTLSTLQDYFLLTHICTSRPAEAGNLPHPVRFISDWHELLHADCDAFIIATPPAVQAEILQATLAVGKPALIEKPLCLDAATAEKLRNAARKSGTPVLIDHIHLFNPWYRALKEALTASGEPIRVIVSEGMNLGPFRAHTPALWDWAPHDLSLCLDLMGASPAQLDALAGPPAPHAEPECASIRLDFDAGASAWIQAGSLGQQKRRQLSVFTDTAWYRFDDLAQEKAVAFRWSFPNRYRESAPPARYDRVLVPSSTRPPLEEALLYFAQGLHGGDRSRFGLELGAEVVRLLSRCEAAMRAHSPLRV